MSKAINIEGVIKKFSLKYVGPIFFAGLVISYILFFGTPKIAVKDYLGMITLTFAALSLISFYLGFYLRTSLEKNKEKLAIKDHLPALFMSVVFAGAYTMLLLVLSYMIVNAFEGGIVLRVAGAFGIGATAAFAFYFGANKAGGSTTLNLAGNLAIFMFGGLLLSALSVTDPYWYLVSFSYLGMDQTTAAKIFNFTMIFSGLGALVVMQFLYRELLDTLSEKQLAAHGRALKRMLFLVGAGIVFVGLIPYKDGIQGQIHTLAACLSGASFILVCMLSKKLIPGLSAIMYNLSYLFAFICASSVIFFGLGHVSLASIELIIFISVFIWVYLMAEGLELKRTVSTPSLQS